MSKESTIKAWLNHPNRTKKKGLELYQEYGTNINLMRFMKRLPEDEKVINILDTQLRQLIGLSVLPEQVDIKPVKKVDPPKDRGIVLTHVFVDEASKKLEGKQDPFGKEPGSRPEVLLDIYKSKDEAYVEAKNLNSILIAKGDEMDKFEEDSKEYLKIAEERKGMAKQIIALFDKVIECWKLIDYYSANGKLPEEGSSSASSSSSSASDIDPIALDRAWRNLGSKISRAKKNPEKNQEKLIELYKESNDIATTLNTHYNEDKYKMRQYETPSDKKEEKQ